MLEVASTSKVRGILLFANVVTSQLTILNALGLNLHWYLGEFTRINCFTIVSF